jgi:hypothetical protein
MRITRRFCRGLTLNMQYMRELCKLNHVLLHGMHFVPWIYFNLVIIYYGIPLFLCRISVGYISSTKHWCTIGRSLSTIYDHWNNTLVVYQVLLIILSWIARILFPVRTTKIGVGQGRDNHLLDIMLGFKGALFSLPLESIRLNYFVSFSVLDRSNHTSGNTISSCYLFTLHNLPV